MKNAIQSVAVCALSITGNSAFSHEGHGLPGAHWHATDAWGFVALAVLLGVAIWLSRGGK